MRNSITCPLLCDFRLFEAYPDVKGRFGPLSAMSPEDREYQREISKHGVRVLQVVDRVLSMHDNLERNIQSLHELGSKHIMFNAKAESIDVSRL